MKNQPRAMNNHKIPRGSMKNQPGNMKDQPGTTDKHKNPPETMKNQPRTLKSYIKKTDMKP